MKKKINITTLTFTKNIYLYFTGFPQQISTAILNITVIDGNDNAPVFVGAPYSTELAEGTIGARRLILNVNATDADSGTNGVVTYSIAGGGSAGNFEIDSVTVSLHVCMQKNHSWKYSCSDIHTAVFHVWKFL